MTTASLSCPLYLYPEIRQRRRLRIKPSAVNLDPKLYAAICKAAGIDPADQAGPDDDFRAATGEARPSEVKVFDYIYGVLHSPAYRETFAEFLKIDFPRIPIRPPEVFRHVSEKGEQLRRLHLMEPAAIGDAPYPYMGKAMTGRGGFPKWEKSSPLAKRWGRGTPQGGGGAGGATSPAWPLRHPLTRMPPPHPARPDREDIGPRARQQGPVFRRCAGDRLDLPHRWLSAGPEMAEGPARPLAGFEDITHYQQIVKILAETDRIMKEIELPLD